MQVSISMGQVDSEPRGQKHSPSHIALSVGEGILVESKKWRDFFIKKNVQYIQKSTE